MLQVRDVAIDRACRHFQPLGEECRRGEPATADQLDDLEQAVGAAHGVMDGRLNASANDVCQAP